MTGRSAAEGPASYLDIYLGPLREQLDRSDVTDIYINCPGELWIETLGGAIERLDVPEVTDALLWRLARQVASITHQGISREHPLLAARLPDGARVQVVAPPATRGPMAIAIRKHVSVDLSLADYQASGAFAQTRNASAKSPDHEQLSQLYAAGDWAKFLAAAVKARQTILISGGTSTGKTTFLNALLREIDPAERLIAIEDTPELTIQHDNALGLVSVRSALGEAQVSTDDLLVASLRMRPDRIIVGEVRGAEALTFLRAINTGHPGSLTTIHADSPERALDHLGLMISQSQAALRRQDILAYAAAAIDVTVQLARFASGRAIAEIQWKQKSS